MKLIKINETNKNEYKQFEQDTDLYDYQSRIYPDETCDIVLWYYINEDDKNIGSVWLEIKRCTDKEAKLGIFIANPMYRGKGICRKAIDEIIRLNASKYGLSVIRLNVREKNIRAQRAYLSCGFVEKDRYVKENGVAVVKFDELYPAWNHDIEFKGDVRFVWELIGMEKAPLPILLCEDDTDFSCIVIVVDVTILEDLSGDDEMWQLFGTFISDDFLEYINDDVIPNNLMMNGVNKLNKSL